jgi:hypothetical protein
MHTPVPYFDLKVICEVCRFCRVPIGVTHFAIKSAKSVFLLFTVFLELKINSYLAIKFIPIYIYVE